MPGKLAALLLVACWACVAAKSQTKNSLTVSGAATANSFSLFTSSASALLCTDSNDHPVVNIVASALTADAHLVSGKEMQVTNHLSPEGFTTIAGTIGRSEFIDELISHKHLDVSAIKGKWEQSDAAYDTILALTDKYDGLAGEKCKYMMDLKPRKLAVFDKVPQKEADKAMLQARKPLLVLNGNNYEKYTGQRPLAHGLGYQRGAISMVKGSSVQYPFIINKSDSVSITLGLAPNHPAEGTKIRYSIQLDDRPVQTVDYATQGKSEEWKQNVLTNQAIRSTRHFIDKPGKHTIKITALDEGVVLDQVKVFSE